MNVADMTPEACERTDCALHTPFPTRMVDAVRTHMKAGLHEEAREAAHHAVAVAGGGTVVAFLMERSRLSEELGDHAGAQATAERAFILARGLPPGDETDIIVVRALLRLAVILRVRACFPAAGAALADARRLLDNGMPLAEALADEVLAETARLEIDTGRTAVGGNPPGHSEGQ